jgi:LuxR family transcriptional regulator, maltose regulon positive regulatory protein
MATLVRRDRLDAALDRAAEHALTVVAAPAGWGKTVALTAWAAERAAAWISIGPNHAQLSSLEGDLDRAMRQACAGGSAPLVVDDAQLLDSAGVEAIRALVREGRAPIIVASRCDLDLGLPRLRVEGRLAELRSADLAFTDDELAALLDLLGIELTADRRRQLLSRTDGWAAGIRLAAVAVQASNDPERLLDEFSGDDRVVADYLTDEVLAAQKRDVGDFLLRTSIVDRLDVDLAAALTDRADAAAVLAQLERQGAFVVAIDRRRRCYRYHALFAELLRARLRLEQPSAVPDLHERAADWYRAHGCPDLAVRHALAAGSHARTRQLLAEHWLDVIAGGHAAPTIDALEDDLRLTVVAAHAHLAMGDRAGALDRLTALEGADGWVGTLAALLRAHAAHDLAAARRIGAEAIDGREGATGPCDEVGRALALQLLGASELARGTVEVAADRLEDAAALAAVPGRERLRLDCIGPIAVIDVVRGRLSRAHATASAAVELARRHAWERAPAAGWALAALAAVAWLRGDHAAAERRARAAATGAAADGDVVLGNALRAIRAHLHAARGDEDGARALLHIVRDTQPDPRGVLARWLEALGPAPWATSAGDGPAETTGAAMRRLRAGDAGGALRLVMELDLARAVHPTVRMSCLLVEAVARENLHEPGAVAALEQALELSEPEGLLCPFLVAGAPLRDVLRRHAGLCDANAPRLAQILDALPRQREDAAPGPVEPLSERERAVLRLMPTILANSEIAGELFVSVNTVKTHARSIYRKLDVGSRREAVARACDLGLL